jgi:hypothetical protein
LSRLIIGLLCTALFCTSCAVFGSKQLPVFTGLGIQQVSGASPAVAGAAELSCRVDQKSYEIEDLSMVLQFHDCRETPVLSKDDRRYLKDPMIVGESLRPDADFAPTVHGFVHAFPIGPRGVDPRACVTFRCRAKYRSGSESATLESRFCRGAVSTQRICSGGR